MKLNILYGLFFVLSTLLIVVTLTDYMKDSFLSKNQKEIRVQKSKKNYLKKRDEFVPTRTLSMAQKEMDIILDKNPYLFDNKSTKKMTLLNLVKVLNNLEEDAILTISTYYDKKGSKVYNFELSQKRADILKKYFREKTSLPLIVAIGYGGVISLKKEDKREYRQIQINLKRIK